MITRFEALKAVDDIFNYCEEIDHSIPESERSGYEMLPDIHKIRKYIIENDRPHGEWIRNDNGTYYCSICQSWIPKEQHYYARYCLHCGRVMKEGERE